MTLKDRWMAIAREMGFRVEEAPLYREVNLSYGDNEVQCTFSENGEECTWVSIREYNNED